MSQHPVSRPIPDQSIGEPSSRLSSPAQYITEKSTIHDVAEVQSNESKTSAPDQILSTWRPSVLRVGPLAGLVALLFAFLQIFASYAVLQASDGSPIESWKYQPTVYLAILVAISNKALAFAAIQGTIVTFWLRLLKGTTIGQLHRDWAYGFHMYKAMMAGRHFNALALACICATLVAMDGPLLQRASSVRQSVPTNPVQLDVMILPELPAYSTGIVDFSALPTAELVAWTNPFYPILHDYQLKTPISAGNGAISGCDKSCETFVRAPALAVDYCTSRLEPRNYTKRLDNQQAQLFENQCYISAQSDLDIFRTSFFVYNGTVEYLNFTTIISDHAVQKHCVGHVNITSCMLVSAIAEYHVTIEGGEIQLQDPANARIVAKANNTAITEETIEKYHLVPDKEAAPTQYNSTLGGIGYVAVSNFRWAQQLVEVPGIQSRTPIIYPALVPVLYKYIHNSALSQQVYKSDCAPGWHDPREDIMGHLNELMFRTGVGFAQSPNISNFEKHLDEGMISEINSTVMGTTIAQVTVYSSDFSYFAGAAAVELFTIGIILYTFYGWWRLGRNTSLSPLETAKAFDAPLLVDVPSNLNGRAIASYNSTRKVQYGALNDETELDDTSGQRTEKLMIADENGVHKPTGTRLGLGEIIESSERILKNKRRKGEA